MKKIIIVISFILFTVSIFYKSECSAQTNNKFQMGKDDLCFLNRDPDLAKFGFWGILGAKNGVCQGIAGLSKIFYENVEFRPNEPKNIQKNLENIKSAFQTYRSIPATKIQITGFSGLNELCQDYRDLFLEESITLNRDIAVFDIAPFYPEFNDIKGDPITTNKQQIEIDHAIKKQQSILVSGHYPMILVYSHVMLVTDIQYADSEYKYTYYDSNYTIFKNRVIKYGADGLPLLGQKMLWDITVLN